MLFQREFPVVVKLHGPAFRTLADEDRQSAEGRNKIHAEGEALRRAGSITSPSRCALDETIAHYGLRPRLAVHVRNPLSLSPGTALWSLQGCDPETVLFVGRFDALKGADRVLRAFRAVLDQRPGSRLVFIGPDRGIQSAEGCMQNFKAFVDELFTPEQQQHIVYLGPKPPEEIAAIRTKAMVTVVASRWESQGYTALEAMLQGCPVICADTSGLRELVRHGVNGLLFSGESDDLAERILELLAKPGFADQLGRQARLDVADAHDPAKIANETLSVYETARDVFC